MAITVDSYNNVYDDDDRSVVNLIDGYTLQKRRPFFKLTDYLDVFTNTGSKSKDSTSVESFFNRGTSSTSSSDNPSSGSSSSSSESVYPATMTLPEVLDKEGVKYKVTNHRRSAAKASKFKTGTNSWHYRSDWAWDIVPADGSSWEELKRQIYGNPRIVNYLKQEREVAPGVVRSLGALDETRDDILAKTGGTGKHIHVGPDTSAIKMLKDYVDNPSLWSKNNPVSKAKQGTSIHINKIGGILKFANGDMVQTIDSPFGESFEPVLVSENELNFTFDDSSIKGSDLGIDYISELGLPVAKPNTPEASYNFDRQKKDYKEQETKETSSTAASIGEVQGSIKGFKSEEIKRALQVASILISKGNFTKEQAAAQVAVYLDENKCNPHSHMKAEKAGKGADSTKGANNYGAGFASLTGKTKKEVLKASGLPESTKVEDLSLEQQCDLVINAANNSSFSRYYNVLRKAKTLEEAMPAAYLLTAGVGFSQKGNWKNLPTIADAERTSAYYGKSNDARFGKSAHHNNSFQRRYSIAKQMLEIINKTL